MDDLVSVYRKPYATKRSAWKSDFKKSVACRGQTRDVLTKQELDSVEAKAGTSI
jgi:hypothetical protein